MSASTMTKIIKKHKPITAPYRTSLQDFKLRLIKEVQKHDIIWKTRAGRNREQLTKAWDDVLTALMKAYKKEGNTNSECTNLAERSTKEGAIKYCKRRWKELETAFKDHLSPYSVSAMSEELAAHMAFMEPYLNKAPLQNNPVQLEPTASTSGLNSRTVPLEANKMTVKPATISGDQKIKMELIGSIERTQSQCEPMPSTTTPKKDNRMSSIPKSMTVERASISGDHNIKMELMASIGLKQPQCEPMPSTSTPNGKKDNTMSPEPETAETRKSSVAEEHISVARAQALAVIDYFFSSFSASTISELRAELVRTFAKVQPEDNRKIIAYATSQMRIVGNYLKIDWSNLDISADVCQAVWFSYVSEKILKTAQRAG